MHGLWSGDAPRPDRNHNRNNNDKGVVPNVGMPANVSAASTGEYVMVAGAEPGAEWVQGLDDYDFLKSSPSGVGGGAYRRDSLIDGESLGRVQSAESS